MLDLAAIRTRCVNVVAHQDTTHDYLMYTLFKIAIEDVPTLLAEIDRLQKLTTPQLPGPTPPPPQPKDH